MLTKRRSFVIAIYAIVGTQAVLAFSNLRASPRVLKYHRKVPSSIQSPWILPNASTMVHSVKRNPPELDKSSRQLNTAQLAVNNLLRLLWKGITLPFPVLRGLANDSADSLFTLTDCLCAIGAYLATGVLAYSVVLEKWSVVDALYFSVVTFTTVGYGDMAPSNVASKLFTCCFGLGGVVLLGAVLSSIGSRLVNAEIEAIQSAERASRRRLIKVLDTLPSIVANNVTLPMMFQRKKEPDFNEKQTTEPSSRQRVTEAIKSTVKSVVSASSVLIVGGLIMGRLEGWSWRDSLYYSLITAGTLGFGDFSPHTRAGRIWGIAFIPLAVAASGEVLGNIASALTERRQKKAYDRILKRELTMEYILQMDVNGDGKVSRDEFIQGMLVELKLVDPNQIKELNEQFDRLDVSKNGTLEKDDLKLLSQQSGISESASTG